MARETIASIKTDLKVMTDKFELYHKMWKDSEEMCIDLESRLDYADKVNLANIGMLNFLRGQVDVYSKMTDTQEWDCEECLSDNPMNNA